MNGFYVIKQLLLDGVEFQFGKVTLCDLQRYSRFRGHRRWQVYSDDKREKFYYVYKDIDQAIVKWLELKKKVDSRVR